MPAALLMNAGMVFLFMPFLLFMSLNQYCQSIIVKSLLEICLTTDCR